MPTDDPDGRDDDTTLPVVEPPDRVAAPATAVVGVLLAAGTSDRFGAENKLLADLGGRPLVARAAQTLLAADLDAVVAVVGHGADRVSAVLPAGVEPVENSDYGRGQGTSVAVGAEAARARGADAAVFALGDQPRVAPATVDALVRAHGAGAGDALAAAHRGTRGNPVLFDASLFDDLAALDGSTGGRTVLLSADDAALVETGDPGVLRDVDRPTDLEELR